MRMIQNPHSKDLEELYSELTTDKYGLTTEEATKRLEIYGPNELDKGKGKSIFSLILHQFFNPLVGILLLAVIIVIIAEIFDKEESHMADAYVILAVIIINAIFGFSQEYKAEKSIEALKKMGAPLANVLRKDYEKHDIEYEVEATKVVPGDILILSTGDRIPADGRLIEEMNLHCDESMLTGESLSVSKNLSLVAKDAQLGDRKNMVFGGTLIVKGRGKAIVTATGMQSEMGKIATLIQETEDVDPPIKKKINQLTKILGILALAVFLIVLIVGLIIIGTESLLTIFLFAVAGAVSSIPEGLLIVLTVTLAVAINHMAKRNAIIRKMQAVDTLGTISAIVSDKTGTLTTNQMTVRKIWTHPNIIDVKGSGFNPSGKFQINQEDIDPLSHNVLKSILEVGILCNDSSLRNHPDKEGEHWKITGDPTEAALIVAAAKASIQKDHLELDLPRVNEIGFDSSHKYMVTFHQPVKSTKILTYIKGAPEKVLQMCSHIETNDRITQLTDDIRADIASMENELAQKALRVLGFAYLETNHEHHDKIKSKFPDITSLVFLGLVGMIDPPRIEAKESIRSCKNAGIEVYMATGDHKLTAIAIANELGISGEGEKAITGIELQDMSQSELEEKVLQTHVFARVTPEHKHRIVSALQHHGKIVAVTGDGINDAPALKVAEVGVAMGITGTDVTKETADMVLLDDNFASIVNAIEEGRVVFENIRKVVKYLVTTNVGEDITIILALLLFPFLFPLIVGVTIPPEELIIFTAIQILWVNLVTDGPLDITIAVEQKEKNLMDEKPRDPNTNIINKEIIGNIIIVASIMAVGIISIYLGYHSFGYGEKAQTVAFVCLIFFQIFNALNCRSRTQSVFQLGFFTNIWLILAIASSIVLTFLATVIPFFQTILRTQPLGIWDWCIIVLVSSSVWVADEIRKWVQFRRKRRNR
ncbi:MAG: HAD-IC family P-type ATPase [Candidatus Lokiarchaeota archaeon]|nr:HAD-IC family P-type ATPase [Candidatus Lokiarchaeota archaeon]